MLRSEGDEKFIRDAQAEEIARAKAPRWEAARCI